MHSAKIVERQGDKGRRNKAKEDALSPLQHDLTTDTYPVRNRF